MRLRKLYFGHFRDDRLRVPRHRAFGSHAGRGPKKRHLGTLEKGRSGIALVSAGYIYFHFLCRRHPSRFKCAVVRFRHVQNIVTQRSGLYCHGFRIRHPRAQAAFPLLSGYRRTRITRYPRIEYLEQLMRESGFSAVKERTAKFTYALENADAYKGKAFSCLHLISDEAHARGVARMTEDLLRGPIACSSRYTMLWATK